MATYSEKLKDPRWQKKRLEILERDDWTCTSCGDHKNTLHVHHLKYENNPWDIDSGFLKTLCQRCHEKEHFSKKESNEELIKYNPIELTSSELLSISYDCHYAENPKDVPAIIQWGYKQILKTEELTDDDFYKKYPRASFNKNQLLEHLKSDLHLKCFDWGFIVIDSGFKYGLNK